MHANCALRKCVLIDSCCTVQVGMLVFWPRQCILADFVEGTEILICAFAISL